ncbi:MULTISPECIES: transcriptional regulator [unclassified Pseudoalteromonas]|uniref:transcriptional regulator n=1 Tax=unclassified Pseudoalteromonas TaxID=194690 RepID=UPI00390C43DE
MYKAEFDHVIHAPNRLQICSILSITAEIEFKVLREELDLSESALSKHLKTLVQANYVCLSKRTDFGRQRTWLSLTKEGQRAYLNHVSALNAIVKGL